MDYIQPNFYYQQVRSDLQAKRHPVLDEYLIKQPAHVLALKYNLHLSTR